MVEVVSDHSGALRPSSLRPVAAWVFGSTLSDGGRAAIYLTKEIRMPDSKSGADARWLAQWEPRIGREAAMTWQCSLRNKRLGMAYGLVFVAFEVGFQIAKLRLGVELSALWFLVLIGYLVHSFHLLGVAKRQSASFLEMPESDRWAIPLGFASTFDRWLAARGKPGWPRKAANRY